MLALFILAVVLQRAAGSLFFPSISPGHCFDIDLDKQFKKESEKCSEVESEQHVASDNNECQPLQYIEECMKQIKVDSEFIANAMKGCNEKEQAEIQNQCDESTIKKDDQSQKQAVCARQNKIIRHKICEQFRRYELESLKKNLEATAPDNTDDFGYDGLPDGAPSSQLESSTTETPSPLQIEVSSPETLAEPQVPTTKENIPIPGEASKQGPPPPVTPAVPELKPVKVSEPIEETNPETVPAPAPAPAVDPDNFNIGERVSEETEKIGEAAIEEASEIFNKDKSAVSKQSDTTPQLQQPSAIQTPGVSSKATNSFLIIQVLLVVAVLAVVGFVVVGMIRRRRRSYTRFTEQPPQHMQFAPRNDDIEMSYQDDNRLSKIFMSATDDIDENTERK